MAAAVPPESSDAPASETRIDRLAGPLVTAFSTWVVLAVAIAMAPVLALWPLLHWNEIAYLGENKLSQEHRIEILVWLVVALLVGATVYVVRWRLAKRKEPTRTLSETAADINRYAFVVLTFPILVAIFQPGIETSHPFITLLFICLVAALAAGFAYRLLDRRRVEESEPRRSRPIAPLIVLALLGLGYAFYFSWLSILDHRNLGTHFLDLAIYDNLAWHTSRGEFLACSLCEGGTHTSTHFDPILVVLTPFYAISSRAETLLVFQSVWLASAVIPLYLLGRHHLGNAWFGVAVAATYVFYPALHGANMYDFHSLTLMVPSFLWAVYFVDRRSVVGYTVALGVMMLTREDMPLVACFIGVYALLRGWYAPGLATLMVAPTWFIIVKKFIMYRSDMLAVGHFVGRYKDMIPHPEENLKGLVISAFTNPTFAVQVLFREEKVFYYAALLVPLLFLPLIAGRKRVLCLYAVIFIGLANLKYHYSLHFQYSVVILGPLLVCLPEAWQRVRDSSVPSTLGLRAPVLAAALAVAVPFASLLAGLKFGALAPNDSFRAGWNRIEWKPADETTARYQALRDIIATLPAEASVCATSTVSPHVSNRDEVRVWPNCKDAEYVVLLEDSLKKKDHQRLRRGLKRKQWAPVGEPVSGLRLLRRTAELDKSHDEPDSPDGPSRPGEEDQSMGGG